MKTNQIIVIIAIILLGVATALAPGVDGGTKASIWVAAGTLALALITWWSLSQTRAQTHEIIAAENRRHQQSFAPLLLMTDMERSGDRFQASVYNGGYGLAFRIHVTLEGELSSPQLRNVPPTGALQSLPNVPIPDASRDHHIGVVARKQLPSLYFPAIPDYNKAHLTRVHIQYLDMFGNTYTTTYHTFTENPNDFDWVPPSHVSQ